MSSQYHKLVSYLSSCYNFAVISEEDKTIIADLAVRYKVRRGFLFGSALDPAREAQNIKLAVEELPPENFFRFYGDLIFSLSKPVEIVDLSNDTKFNQIIRREGKVIYD